MATAQDKELLKDPRVVDEINRHLWIESEKAGRDIGFDTAAADWLKKYAKDWLKHNRPARKAAVTKPGAAAKKASVLSRKSK